MEKYRKIFTELIGTYKYRIEISIEDKDDGYHNFIIDIHREDSISLPDQNTVRKFYKKYINNKIKEKLNNKFSIKFKEIINSKGLKNSFIYKRANIDRKLFSKIISNDNYTPSKRTILALCIAAELDINNTIELLSCAGYALSDSLVQDVIVKYFIENKIFDVEFINNVLHEYNQKLLGSI